MTIPALIWVDKWGRRPTLLVGSALMATFLFATAGLLANYGHYVPNVEGNENVRWSVSGPPSKAVIACSYLFVASFAITWVYLSCASLFFCILISLTGSGLLDIRFGDISSPRKSTRVWSGNRSALLFYTFLAGLLTAVL